MNILHLSPCQGAFGGIEAFVLAVGDELHATGGQVRVVFKKVKGFQLQPSLEQAIKDRPYSIRFIDRLDLRPLGKDIQWANIVHGHNPLIEAVFMAKWFRKPCVLTVYNWCRRNWHPRPWLWRFANRLADHRWYISDFVWDSWEPEGRLESSGKLPIISSLPAETIPFDKREGFVFASRWVPNKGLLILLEAYSRANIDRNVWPLTLMGDGPLKKEVLTYIQQKNLTQVKVTGFISDEERNRRISHAMWMVTPPHTKEDLGLTVIESRNVKVPCIITRDGGLPEAAGRNALVCKPGDVEGLKNLLEKSAKMTEMEYIQLAEETYLELKRHLKPLSLYSRAYRNTLRAHNHRIQPD